MPHLVHVLTVPFPKTMETTLFVTYSTMVLSVILFPERKSTESTQWAWCMNSDSPIPPPG